MTMQTKKTSEQKEIQEEMVGVLNAISIVSKRLANRLIELEMDEEPERQRSKKKKPYDS